MSNREENVKIATAERVECFEKEIEAFLREVFGLEAGCYLVTDLSSLGDFFPMGLTSEDVDSAQSLSEVHEMWDRWVLGRIEAAYGVRPAQTAVLLADLMWMLGQAKAASTRH